MKTLLLGGARSGKSTLATQWAQQRSGDVCVLVTASESDPEMAARIAAHRRARPSHWRVRAEGVRLGTALHEEAARAPVVLVDCLTLWIANCLWHAGQPEPDQTAWQRERADFLEALRGSTAQVIVVSNEVGAGIVPENAAARLFRDEQGWVNQAVAQLCEEVFFVAAGLPLRLKPPTNS
jgi:adenosylcobinamide kinase / adenosylcobinamide-phosphate guanylyltransferase